MAEEWYTTGEESFETQDKKHGQSGGFDPSNIFRFFMPKGNTEPRKVLFLDDEPFNVYMHQYEAGGHWGNWESCPLKNGKRSDWCPLCQKQEEKLKVTGRMIGHYTILDLTGYDDKDGVHHMPVKILPANHELVSILKLRKSGPAKGNLKGAIFSVVRTKGAKNSLGNDWTFEKHVDLEKFTKQILKDVKRSLDYLPKDWGFWEGSEDDKDARKNYKLKGFPFSDILLPLDAEKLAARMSGGEPSTYKADSFDSYDSNNDDDDEDEIAY